MGFNEFQKSAREEGGGGDTETQRVVEERKKNRWHGLPVLLRTRTVGTDR